jgi:hypothetical protein
MNSMSLLFEVSSTYFKIYCFDQENISKSWILDIGGKSDIQKKELINDFIIREGISLLDYSDALVFWSNEQTVLVPSNLFENTSAETLLKLNFGDNFALNTSDFNRIPYIGVVCVYSIPTWIKSFFVIKFSGTKIIHTSTAWTKYLCNKNSSGKLIGLIVLDSEFLTFNCFYDNKPLIYIQTKFQEMEDVIYHVSYSLQQTASVNLDGNIELFDISGRNMNLINSFTEKINNLGLLANIKFSIHEKVDIAAFKLCV